MSSPLDRFSLTEEEVSIATAEDTSSFTQQARMYVVTTLTAGGLPDDPKEQTILLKALADMDKTSAQNRRLQIEKDVGDDTREIREIVRRLHEQNTGQSQAQVRTEPPVPDASALPDIEYDREQLEQGLVQETSKEFLERHRRVLPNADSTTP